MNKTWSAPNGPWKGTGIAIVGIAGRFPQARSVDEFWQNLIEERDCISRLSREEMLKDGVAPATMENERFVPAGGVLEDIELFDASYFGIPPREAQSMDPQQRLFLEVVQHAFDDAGMDPVRVPGPVGVYAGSRLSGYWLHLMNIPEFMNTMGWHQVAAGNDKDFLSTQASFRFNLSGPSVNVQAACSSSLIAVALGCDALILGHCDVAVAGGASISVPQRTGYIHQPDGLASADGQCRPFDAAATGSVLGNGVAAVVLKRVDDAIESGDRIYAVIRSVELNNDGRSKSSFAAPSVKAQTEVIRSAIQHASISPSLINYIETHGTATALGDSIEIAALKRALSNGEPRDAPCGIGSVKSNIGHLDPVAGVTSLIKVALSLHHGIIPASIHFDEPNPSIDFVTSGVRVVSRTEAWKRSEKPRYAGVSSFGIGGTNVHAILEEAPVYEERPSRRSHHLLVLSGKSAEALQALELQTAEHLQQSQDISLGDAAFTLSCGRGEFQYRRAIIASSREDAAGQLERNDPARTPRFLKDRQIVFMFHGQGGQYLSMGRDLYRSESIFRTAVDEVFALAEQFLGFDGRILIDKPVSEIGSEHDVTQTVLAQPLLFAIGYASSRLWLHWGVEPHLMFGHSIGELVAAYVAGVLSLPDAVRAACERGRLMQQMPSGAMLAVALDEKEALALENENIRVSAFNGPKQHVLSGTVAAIDVLERNLERREARYHRLATSHAFHHPSMGEAAARFQEIMNEIDLKAPKIPFVSCTTAKPITPEQATDPAYWGKGIVAPIRFSQGVRNLLSSPALAFIECGAGQSLGNLVHSHRPDADYVVVVTVSNREDSRTDRMCALDALGTLWQAGIRVNWNNFWHGNQRRRVKMPPYPFQRKRYWVDAPKTPKATTQTHHVQPSPAEKCYSRIWQPLSLDNASQAAVSGTWIVLTDLSGLGDALCDRIRQTDVRAIAVGAGAGFQNPADDAFYINPNEPQDIKTLMEKAAIQPGAVHLVNCWPAFVPPGPLTIERGELGALLSLITPVQLLQALAGSGRSVKSVHTLTSRLFAVAHHEIPEPVIAPAIGLTRVIPQEVQGLRARIIDVALPGSNHQANSLLDHISAELWSNALEPIVAYRDGIRLCESFAPISIPSQATLHDHVHAGGTYLITGGFGGIGGVFARAIASTDKARLVLIGRHGLEGADGNNKRSAAARQLVHELEEMGATVLPMAADVSNPAQVSHAISEVESSFGRINGVLHAAGIPGGRMLMASDSESARAVLAPKLQGTIALLNRIASHQPDFIAMTSSFAAITGGVGQGDYAAGNAFIDAMAWFARAHGIRAIAINWPAWREVGMAQSMSLPTELEHLRQATLDSGITPDEGLALFAQILATDIPQVIVPPHTAGETGAVAAAPESTVSRPTPQPIPARDPQRSESESDSVDAILVSRIGDVWSDVLGVPEVHQPDNFFELGGQSLLALQIVSRISEQYAVELNLTDMFGHPTLEEFAALVHQRLVERIAAMSDEEVSELVAKE